MARLKRRCTTCGRKLTAPEVAAAVETPLNRWFWCMECWDNDDEKALRQYQAAQVMRRLPSPEEGP